MAGATRIGDVLTLRRAMEEAQTWSELLQLGQHIWDYPVERFLQGDRAPGRAQLCDTYVRAVGRLWSIQQGPWAPSRGAVGVRMQTSPAATLR
jgi:hypothetical protein